MNKSYLHLLFSRQTLAWYLIHGGFHAPESLPRGPGILTKAVFTYSTRVSGPGIPHH